MKRPVADYDDMGSVKYNLVQFSEAHSCRISENVPVEINSGPEEYSEASTMVYVSSGTTFEPDDEVHHSDSGRVYIVLGVMLSSVSDHHQTLVCKLQTDA
jgi:hypothetical protein